MKNTKNNEDLQLYLYFKFFKLIIRTEIMGAKIKELFSGRHSA